MPPRKPKSQSPAKKAPAQELVGETVSDAMELWREAAKRWDKYLKAGSNPPPEIIRDVYSYTELVFRAYCLPDNWPNPDGPPREFLSIRFVLSITNDISYLGKGVLPDSIRFAIVKNRPVAGFHETKDIALAVAYIEAAKEVLTSDKSPIKTVATAYEVDRSTVHRWRRNMSWVTPKDFYQNAKKAEHGSLLKEGMLAAAERYRIAGRSTGAVARRERKRSKS